MCVVCCVFATFSCLCLVLQQSTAADRERYYVKVTIKVDVVVLHVESKSESGGCAKDSVKTTFATTSTSFSSAGHFGHFTMDFQGFPTRFKYFVNLTNPYSLIYADQTVLDAKAALDSGAVLDPKLREEKQRLVNAAIHPVTGEIIQKPFRVSAIAPVNIPLIYLMLLCPASNVPGTIFLHWLNQSYNTACNYANRSGADQAMGQLMKAYGLAVTSACTLAYGLGRLAANNPMLRSSGAIIPCVATAAANISNIGFTRMDEILTGTKVFDEHGTDHGISAKAGQTCVMQTALTRCVLVPTSCLLLPPLVMKRLAGLRCMANPSIKLGVELAVIYVCLQLALPAALAVYPQTAAFPVEGLEERFRGLRRKDGSRITVLYANKGL